MVTGGLSQNNSSEGKGDENSRLLSTSEILDVAEIWSSGPDLPYEDGLARHCMVWLKGQRYGAAFCGGWGAGGTNWLNFMHFT